MVGKYRFQFRFGVYPRAGHKSTFSMTDHPVTWPSISGPDEKIDIEGSLNAIQHEEDGAAKLLLCIMWSHILYVNIDDPDAMFWECVRRAAAKVLFEFSGSPEKYIWWIQAIYEEKLGLLGTFFPQFTDGQVSFTVERFGVLRVSPWIDGLRLGYRCIGELPVMKLELI